MADGRLAVVRSVAETAAAMADQRAAAEAGTGPGPDEAAKAASRSVQRGLDEGVHHPPDDDRAELAGPGSLRRCDECVWYRRCACHCSVRRDRTCFGHGLAQDSALHLHDRGRRAILGGDDSDVDEWEPPQDLAEAAEEFAYASEALAQGHVEFLVPQRVGRLAGQLRSSKMTGARELLAGEISWMGVVSKGWEAAKAEWSAATAAARARTAAARAEQQVAEAAHLARRFASAKRKVRERTIALLSARTAAAAVAAVLAQYPRRDRADHQRSQEAKKRRRRGGAPTGSEPTLSTATDPIAQRPPTGGRSASDEPPGERAETCAAEPTQRERDLEQLVGQLERRLSQERRRSDRRSAAAEERGKQKQRRSDKAAARKRKKGREHAQREAVRAEHAEAIKGKRPRSRDELHSGHRKRQQLRATAPMGGGFYRHAR